MDRKTKVTKTGRAADERKSLIDRFAQALLALVSQIPSSGEGKSKSPRERARTLILKASAKAAVVSGTLALPPGPFGVLTIVPDLLKVWDIQRQLIADIAAVYGKSPYLDESSMIHCLFRHTAGQAVRDIVTRVGERFVVRRAGLRVIQRVLRRVGVVLTQRGIGRALSRWLPIVGAVGIGGYAFWDTTHVGNNAIEFFEADIEQEGPEPTPPETA